MPTVDEALAYARLGFPVLPIWPARDGVCACGTNCGRDASKHPITHFGGKPFAEHAARSATRDEKLIRKWWTAVPDANIGLALGKFGDGDLFVLVLDVDHEDIAQRLRQWLTRDWPAWGTAATSRRGLHCYFLTANPPRNYGALHTNDGDRLGELRGDGMYVVAPPSVNVNGVQYRWKGQSTPLDQLAIPVVADVPKRIQRYLKPLGLSVRDFAGPGGGEDGGDELYGPVTAIDPPFSTRGFSDLKLMLRGSWPTHDRSGTIFRIACETYRAAQQRKHPITLAEIAGVVKQADEKDYHKYTDRPDADHWYRLTASKAIKAVDSTPAEEGESDVQASRKRSSGSGNDRRVDGGRLRDRTTKEGVDRGVAHHQPAAPRGQQYGPQDSSARRSADGVYYTFDEGAGLIRHDDRRRASSGNFKPGIEKVVKVITNANAEPEREYILALERGGETVRIKIPAAALHSDQNFRKTLQAALPPLWTVESGQWWNIWNAANYFTESYEEVQQYAITGWVEGPHGPVFLLPSAQAGIGADGFDPDVSFSGWRQKVSPIFNLFGRNVRPVETAEEATWAAESFAALLACLEPPAIVTVIGLVLGATLQSLGLHTSPPFVHLHSKTGMLKTSVICCAMSMLGWFYNVPGYSSTKTETWGSTMNELQKSMHDLRDLPLLIDDYKLVRVKPGEVASFIQSQADRTFRGRLGSDQERRDSIIPEALGISTGEDQWALEESVAARVLAIPVPILQPDSPEMKEHERLVDVVEQRHTQEGLALLGGTWLRWLARLGLDSLRDEIDRLRPIERDKIQGRIHARTVDTTASLQIAIRLITRFLKEELPEAHQAWQPVLKEYEDTLLERTLADAAEAEELAPLAQLCTMIGERFANGKVAFWRVGSNRSDYLGPSGVEGIGFFAETKKDSYLILTERLTMSWFRKERRYEDDPVPFSWKAVVRDARETAGAEYRRIKQEGNINGLWLPYTHPRAAHILSKIDDAYRTLRQQHHNGASNGVSNGTRNAVPGSRKAITPVPT